MGLLDGKKKGPEKPAMKSDFGNSKIYMWIKGLETKINNITRELDLLKGDLLKKNIQIRKEVKTMTTDLNDFRHEQEQMTQKMDLIIKELKKTAGMEEVETLKKYVDFWNPMTFVTQRDLERAVETKIGDQTHSTGTVEKEKT